MATFQQRESGWWQARVRRKGWPAQSRSFGTKGAAEAWARAVEREMDKGSFVSTASSENTTFSEIAGRFLAEFAPHHYRQREDGRESWRFECQHLVAALGKYSVAAITPQLVAKYRDARLREVSGATVRKEINMLSKILTVAAQEFGVAPPSGNPVSNVRKPKAGKGRDRRLSAEEWQALERECKRSRNPWLLAALRLAVETGMRRGELLQLRWNMIDKTRRLALLLDPAKIKTEEPRAVPLSSAAMATLSTLPESIRGAVLPVEPITLYHAFVAACKRAGVDDFTWHDLRHEALSRLAERGDFSVLEIASISGHSTIQTLKRYTHLQAERLAKKLG